MKGDHPLYEDSRLNTKSVKAGLSVKWNDLLLCKRVLMYVRIWINNLNGRVGNRHEVENSMGL
jgi:hypothetical protein